MIAAREQAALEIRRGSALQVYLLGSVDFEAALLFQRRLHYDVSGDRERAALILCEHPPLLSVGRHGSRAHILFEPEELQTRGWPVRWVNRGGGCVLHLPGQLAVYPIFALDQLGLSVTEYVHCLGSALLRFAAEFHVTGAGRLDAAGVYLGQRLFASIGVAVRDWVSYYGAYANIHPSLDLFRRVICDAGNTEPMTSLERERRGRVPPSFARERLIEHVREQFGFERVALFSDHPSLAGYLRRCEPRQAELSGSRGR